MPTLSIEFASDPNRAPDNAITNADLLRDVLELRTEIEACYERIDQLEKLIDGHR